MTAPRSSQTGERYEGDALEERGNQHEGEQVGKDKQQGELEEEGGQAPQAQDREEDKQGGRQEAAKALHERAGERHVEQGEELQQDVSGHPKNGPQRLGSQPAEQEGEEVSR